MVYISILNCVGDFLSFYHFLLVCFHFTSMFYFKTIIFKNINENTIRKEGNVLFNDVLNTFYLRLYGIRHNR